MLLPKVYSPRVAIMQLNSTFLSNPPKYSITVPQFKSCAELQKRYSFATYEEEKPYMPERDSQDN